MHNMEFIDRHGKKINVDPFDQASIDAAKTAAPGEGVGLAVESELLGQLAAGKVANANQLPFEYRHLAEVSGLSN